MIVLFFHNCSLFSILVCIPTEFEIATFYPRQIVVDALHDNDNDDNH